MTYGYIRVSTDKQTVENQRFEILQYCQNNKIHIDSWIEETITVEPEKFYVFWELLYDSLREGKPFPVTDNDILAIMRTISLVKNQNKHIMRVDG